MLAWWCASVALGQVNAEVLGSRITAPGPAMQLDGTLGVSAGNVDSITTAGAVVGQLMTVFEEPEGAKDGPPPFLRDRLLTYATVRRAQFAGAVVESSGLAHLRYTHMFHRRFGAEAFLQGQYDAFLLLNLRFLAGAGLRFDLVHREKAGLWGGSGVMLERERLSDGTDTRAVRSTSFLSGRLALAPYLLLVNTVYLQPNLADVTDFRLLEELRLETKVTGALALTTSLVVRHDSLPPPEVETTDLQLTVGVTVRLARKGKP